MSKTLYRVESASEQARIRNLAEMIDALYADAGFAEQPDSPRFPRGEWYCENPRCTVREVRINDKYLDGKPPTVTPIRYCPECRQRMKFHGYLLPKIVLVPVKETSP